MEQGKLITFEGCEGVGKSTQVKLLAEYLSEKGIDVLCIREPGGTLISEKIRKIILSNENNKMCGECEALLYAAARAQLVAEVIKPSLQKGKLILCDRFTHSSIAYQGYARNLGVDSIEQINQFALGGVRPNLTIFLDLPPADSFARKGGADTSDRLENENFQFHQNVYNGYRAISDSAFISITPLGDKMETHKKIIALLKEYNVID